MPMTKESVERANPFLRGRIVSGWLLPDGQFRWGRNLADHEALAQFLGFKSIEDLRDKNGAVRVWADGDDKTITFDPDTFMDMSSRQRSALDDLAIETKASLRDARGNIIEDYRDQGPAFMPKREKPIEGSLGKGDIKFFHYSDTPNKGKIDPKFFGRSGVTGGREQAGLPRAYAYAEGSTLGQDAGLIDTRKHYYEGSVEKGRIYDGVEDALGYGDMANRAKADQMLIDKGFIGIYREGVDGRKQLEFFQPMAVTEAPKPETTPALAEEALPILPLEEIDYAAQDREFARKKAAGEPLFMPSEKLDAETAAAFMPAPRVDLEDYIGRDVVTLTTDRLDVGIKEVGPVGAKKAMQKEAQGGRGFPLVYTGLGWAFSDPGSAKHFLTRLQATADGDTALVATAVLGEQNVLNSPFGQHAVAVAYRHAIEAGLLKQKAVDQSIKTIFARAAASTLGDPEMKKIKNLEDYEKATEKWPFSFGATRELAKRLDAAELKIPAELRQAIGLDALSLTRSISDPELAGLPNFSLVSLMEIPVDQTPVKDDIHVSYPYTVKGKLLGFLKSPLAADKLISNPRVRKGGQLTAQPMMTVMPSLDLLKPTELNPEPQQVLAEAKLEYAK